MEPGCLSQSLDHTVFTKCTRVPVEIRVPAWWSSEQVMGVSEVEGGHCSTHVSLKHVLKEGWLWLCC